MEIESKKINIEGTEYHYRPNFRAFIEYEKMSGKTINQIDNLNDSAMFLYCGIKSGMKYAKLPFELKYEDFIDKLDDLDVLDVLSDGDDSTEKKKKVEK